jgi:hypothetical protein
MLKPGALMQPRETYWTPARLIELRIAARTMNRNQLCEQFDKDWPELEQALKFDVNRRELKLEEKHEVIAGKRVKITVYAPRYVLVEASTITGKQNLF